jgi:hypothetical protein
MHMAIVHTRASVTLGRVTVIQREVAGQSRVAQLQRLVDRPRNRLRTFDPRTKVDFSSGLLSLHGRDVSELIVTTWPPALSPKFVYYLLPECLVLLERERSRPTRIGSAGACHVMNYVTLAYHPAANPCLKPHVAHLVARDDASATY